MRLLDIHMESGNVVIFSDEYDLDTAVGKRIVATLLRKIALDLDPYKVEGDHVMAQPGV